VPSKEERTGAHRNGGSTVRRYKRRRAAAFVGGGDEVLQLGRVEGVRDLQEISGIGSSGRSSPGSGGRRRCSAGIREGEGAAGGRRRWSGCGERWGSSGAREKGSERSGDGRMSRRASGERAARRQRSRGEKGGGATRHGGAVGPGPDRQTALGSGPSAALAGDVRRARVCRPDRAGREMTDRWAAAQCRAAVPLTGGAGLSAARWRARARVGQPVKKAGLPSPDEQ
jgi:hypothetical protein